uniref:Uncharacterized protein n=1 Tax=Knipowitschia caucasica TaxID=637954 RepID=A0AAV2LJ97_KNICA
MPELTRDGLGLSWQRGICLGPGERESGPQKELSGELPHPKDTANSLHVSSYFHRYVFLQDWNERKGPGRYCSVG